MVSATQKLRDGMRDAWAPREAVSLSQWCGKNLYLPAETGPTPGRFDLERFPWAAEILDAAEDPETEEIILVGATQWGKTTIGQAILAGLAALHPAPAMLCAPDTDATRKLRNKFYGMCDATPALSAMVPPLHKRNMSEIDFGDSLCHLAWTGNTQRVSAESCRVVYVTEVDRAHRAMHEGALHKLISERVKMWFNFLKVFEGTPTDEDSTIIAMYETSDKCLFVCPCPHCGHYQPLRFYPHKEGEYAGCGGVDGLKDDDGNWRTPDDVLEHAFYRCEKGCRIDQRDKDDMVRGGIWCPAGCKIGTDGAMTGTRLRSKRRRGFGGMCSLYADTISIGRMAAEYLDSRDKEEELRNFTNNWVGVRWITPTKVPKSSELWRRLRGTHSRGTVPARAFFLTAGVDVHDSNSKWIVRAWGEGGTSWLVDWGICPIELDDRGRPKLGSQLARIHGLVLDREWPLIAVNPLSQEKLWVAKTGIDCGHEPLMVHNFVRRYNPEAVLTVAGDTHPAAGRPWTFNVVDANTRTGKVYPGGLKRWAINTEYYKADLHNRWDAPLDELGAWWLTDTPWSECETYMRELTNEGRRTVTNKAGFPSQRWVIIQPGLGNHYLDCEVYARALADMVVGGNWENLASRFKVPAKRKSEPAGYIEQGAASRIAASVRQFSVDFGGGDAG